VFEATRYIDWVRQFYGKVPFDLASSGVPFATLGELGVGVPDLDEPTGHARFRQAIAHYNDVPFADAVAAMGTTQALFFAYASVLSPGDELLVEAPGYEPLTRIAVGLGASVRTFERRAGEGFRVNPERVAGAIGPRTRAIVVTNLHNPTGVRTDDATLRELALIAEARGAYLIVDEVYAPFDALPDDGIFRTSARKIAPNVIAVSSLTKCYGLAMHRVGWMLAPPEIALRAENATTSTTGHLPLSHANLGALLLSSVSVYAARARSLFEGKRAIAEAWIAEHPTLQWSAPEAGLFGLVTLPGRGDLLAAINESAAKQGVLVGAGTFFGAPESFRLSWATCDADQFREGLARLEPLVRG
jgi:aspartate/methionine/tyrosine aminotransferase